MQRETPDTTQLPSPGDDALQKDGAGGTGADSALARMKQIERHRDGLRHRDDDTVSETD
jgi:hypothetical protein